MANKRNEVTNLEERVNSGMKKYIRYNEGAQLYSMGLHAFQQLAKDAGAVRMVGNRALVNVNEVDRFIEEMFA